MFAAGISVGLGAGMLLAPVSGEEIRGTIGDKVQDIGDRVRTRFSAETRGPSTGTEGV
jgi:gas vesicle protein